MHAPGRFVWLELESRRLVTLERFYADLLGWGRDALHLPGWGLTPVFTHADHRVGTGHLSRRAFAPTRWVAFVSGDPDRAAIRAAAQGGRIVQPAEDSPGWSRIAEVEDPGGHAVSVLSLEAGDPPPPRAGDLVAMHLWAPGAPALAPFWEAVFDYERREAGERVILTREGRTCLVLDGAPDPPLTPWVPWFASAGLDGDLTRARALGALLVRDEELWDGRRLALFEDPTGGPFGLVG